MKALLLIDLQNDFMPGGTLAVSEGFASVASANQAQPYFAHIIATKDWHPQHHQSFASEHPGKKPGDQMMVGSLLQTLWPDHCIQHTKGAQLADLLDQSRISHVITKGEDPQIDSYSAFFDNAHVRETGLRNHLQRNHIDDIYLLGVATEYCVKHTALDAISLGIKTTVIIDGCRGIELHKEDIHKALLEMKQHGVSMITLAELEKHSKS